MIDALSVSTASLEEGLKLALDALAAVEQRLGADVESANFVGPDVAAAHEMSYHRECHRRDVLVLITHGVPFQKKAACGCVHCAILRLQRGDACTQVWQMHFD